MSLYRVLPACICWAAARGKVSSAHRISRWQSRAAINSAASNKKSRRVLLKLEYNNLIGRPIQTILGKEKAKLWRTFRNSSRPFAAASRKWNGSRTRGPPDRCRRGRAASSEELMSGQVVSTPLGEHFETEKVW